MPAMVSTATLLFVLLATPSQPMPTAQSSNAFGFDLYARLNKTPGNLALSPFSISTALAMTWGGARHDTEQQLGKVLHAAAPRDAAVASWGALSQALQDPARALELRVANRLFGEKTFTFEPAFLGQTKARFAAPLEPVDFKNAAEPARLRINSWVEEKTARRIKDLLPPRSVQSETRLVLVNAVTFVADWQTPFEKQSTFPASFTPAAHAPKQVPTMHNALEARFAQRDGVKVLELPYRGGAALLLVLPDKADGLAAVEQSLDAKRFAEWTAALGAPQRVNVALPSFKVEPAASLPLASELSALGMPLAFDPERADFTGAGTSPDPKKRLYLSEAFHQAFVKVDEKGTEAAAATAVVMADGAGRPPKAVAFAADHPFLFFIVDQPSGLVLFMGRVADPAS
jgi:serpin B